MKTCNGCVHANWKTTAGGKLHPSGDGRCKKEVKIPQLPQAFYWLSSAPIPCGGFINRRKDLSDHCVYWEERK